MERRRVFNSNHSYWLNESEPHRPHSLIFSDVTKLTRDSIFPWRDQYGNESPGIYYVRMQRDGWRLKHHKILSRHHSVWHFERPINAQWTLEKLAHGHIPKRKVAGRGSYYDEYRLKHIRSGESEDHPSWDWADMDRRRLVWAAGGKLLTGRLAKDGLREIKTLHDFNRMTFAPIAAPY